MLRVAIVGAGVMGANHARIARVQSDVQIDLIVDRDSTRGSRLAESLGAQYAPDLRDISRDIDAAIVATPTTDHAEVASALLRRDIHVLVEKPLAPDVAACADIGREAKRSKASVMVGHVERFNPAVLELDRLVVDVQHLEFSRIGPFPPRITDNVVMDLMVHDIDLARLINPYPVATVFAVGRGGIHSSRHELASALIQFENGVTANLTASQLGQDKIRQIVITQRDSTIAVDLVRQDVSVHRLTHIEYLSDQGQTYRQSGITEVPYLTYRGEPLMLEQQHFFDCIRKGLEPRCGVADGTEAVKLATQILNLLGPV